MIDDSFCCPERDRLTSDRIIVKPKSWGLSSNCVLRTVRLETGFAWPDRGRERPDREGEQGSGRRKLAVKVVDIFGNDTMTIVEVKV